MTYAHEQPEGRRAPRSADLDQVGIEWYSGDRVVLRGLFEAAEDSAEQLNAYIDAGRVLVAWREDRPVGHVQLVAVDRAGEVELKNMAVVRELRGFGLGRRLVETAVTRCADEGYQRMTVSTAAAAVGELRFYQRCGFRMLAVERDAFTPATGYPKPIEIAGIPVRDRVWLDRRLP